jgi:hypothetical protein
MPTEIILSLPDETYHRAEQLAGLFGRQIDSVLTDTLSMSLPAFDNEPSVNTPISRMSDAEVESIAHARLDAATDQRLGKLLSKQQQDCMSDNERSELFGLLRVYQTDLLLKAQALHESVERGLRPVVG